MMRELLYKFQQISKYLKLIFYIFIDIDNLFIIIFEIYFKYIELLLYDVLLHNSIEL